MIDRHLFDFLRKSQKLQMFPSNCISIKEQGLVLAILGGDILGSLSWDIEDGASDLWLGRDPLFWAEVIELSGA